MFHHNDERLEGQPLGLGMGTGKTYEGRTVHKGALFYIFKRTVRPNKTTVLVWSESWRGTYSRGWWINEDRLIPLNDINNIEPNCDICKSNCKKEESCAFFKGVWEDAMV